MATIKHTRHDAKVRATWRSMDPIIIRWDGEGESEPTMGPPPGALAGVLSHLNGAGGGGLARRWAERS